MNDLARKQDISDIEKQLDQKSHIRFEHIRPEDMIPLPQIPGIVAALHQRLEPMGADQAINAAKYLTGLWRKADVGDPAAVSKMMAGILAEHSDQIAHAAIQKLARSCKFFPSIAEVSDAVKVEADAVKSRIAMALAMERKQKADKKHREDIDRWLAMPKQERDDGMLFVKGLMRPSELTEDERVRFDQIKGEYYARAEAKKGQG